MVSTFSSSVDIMHFSQNSREVTSTVSGLFFFQMFFFQMASDNTQCKVTSLKTTRGVAFFKP